MNIKYIYILVFALRLMANNLANAQNNTLVAGNINGSFIYNDYSPDVELHYISINTSEYFFVDVNNDSIDDFRFSAVVAGGQGVDLSSVDILPLNNNKISSQYSHVSSVEGGCEPFDVAVGKKYFDGDTIKYDSTFIDSESVYLNVHDSYEGCYNYDINEWSDSVNMYVAYCLIEGASQKLGWFKVRSVTYHSIIIDSYFYNSYSVQVNNIDQEQNIYISPNPTNRFIYIKGHELENVDIYNIYGQCLESQKIYSCNTKIDLKKYEKGIIILQIKTRQGIINKRILLE